MKLLQLLLEQMMVQALWWKGQNEELCSEGERTLNGDHEISELHINRLGIEEEAVRQLIDLRVSTLDNVQSCLGT